MPWLAAFLQGAFHGSRYSTMMKSRIIIRAALVTSLLLALTALPAQAKAVSLDLDDFPDSADLRASLYAESLAGPRDAVLSRKPAVYTNAYGSFRLSAINSGDAFYVILAPGSGGSYPIATQGSWVVKRSLADGRFLQAKVFLRSDAGTFLRIYPSGDRSRMDVVLYGAVLNREVALPAAFEQVLTSSLQDIRAWSSASVDWGLFSPKAEDYDGLCSFESALRARLHGLRYADDGGLDADGKPVFIATGLPQSGKAGLNCSGFAQWVVDGLLSPLGATLPDSGSLSQKHPELRGASVDRAIDARYDPFFGLDWTRNLGLAAAAALDPGHRHSLTENDVSISPFALTSASHDLINGGLPYEAFPAYDVDSGYPMRGLKATLYILAVREPGSAYLASISRIGPSGLRRHYHVALLLPRFDESGNFKVEVFESAAETSLDALLARAPNDYVHLVRLSVSPDFDPPAIP